MSGHVDGDQIRLDEPFDLPPNARVLVTIVVSPQSHLETDSQDLAANDLTERRQHWLRLMEHADELDAAIAQGTNAPLDVDQSISDMRSGRNGDSLST